MLGTPQALQARCVADECTAHSLSTVFSVELGTLPVFWKSTEHKAFNCRTLVPGFRVQGTSVNLKIIDIIVSISAPTLFVLVVAQSVVDQALFTVDTKGCRPQLPETQRVHLDPPM